MNTQPTEQVDDLKGFQGYLQKIKLFSRNARLYLLHVIGMDLIHGTWEVLFNLYLLEAGFGIEFIGMRIAILSVAGAAASIPMGWLSDKIGRKASFILGDGMGAVLALVQIMSINPMVLLIAPAIGSMFGALHHVTESPFMAENSEKAERVHLFSVAGGLRTFSAMGGSLIAGFLPLVLAKQFGWDVLVAYRNATFIGIGWWFLSLIPALMLKPFLSSEMAAVEEEKAKSGGQHGERGGILSNIKNPKTIGKLLLVNAIIALGASFVVPLFNVFFSEGVHAHENEIGITFAAGSLVLAVASLLAPFLSERMGKVLSVSVTRMASVPFILLIGLAPELATPTTIISLAGFAYVMRTTLFNMSGPINSAFTMEILHPGERATVTGLESATRRILTAGGGFIGAYLMSRGDFRTSFFVMAAMYAISTILFWVFFRGIYPADEEEKVQVAPAK